MRSLSRRPTLAAALLGVCLAHAASQAAAQSPAAAPVRPDVMMSALTNEVMGTLREDRAAGRATDLALLVEQRIVPVFDFTRMTMIALARNWRVASAEQQTVLVAQFKMLLVHTYSQALVQVRDETIEYRPLRAAPGDTELTVRSALRRPGVEPLTIDYEMAESVAGWMVYDVKLAGVSLVLAYRESFAAAVRTGGIDGLIKTLDDKNRQNRGGAEAIEASKLAPLLLIYGAPRPAKP